MKQLRRLSVAIAILLIGTSLLWGAGAGEDDQRSHDASGVREVRLTTSGTLFLRQGTPERLEVDAGPGALRGVDILVEGERLTIRHRSRPFSFFSGPVNYYLVLEDIDSVLTTSSGDIRIERIETRELELAADSSGDIELDSLQAEFLDVRLTSSGDLRIGDGRVTSQRIRCSSSGDYRAADLASETAEITLTSSGDARVSVRARLTARLSSSGDLILRGEPMIDALRITSSGQLKRE